MLEMRSIVPLSAMMRGFAGKVSSLANFNMVLEALKAHFQAPNNFILLHAGPISWPKVSLIRPSSFRGEKIHN